jgi:hypothetical protein
MRIIFQVIFWAENGSQDIDEFTAHQVPKDVPPKMPFTSKIPALRQ